MNLTRSWLLFFIKLSSLFILYYFSARMGIRIGATQSLVTLVWPPTGISLAFLFLFGVRLWPAILLGSFFANINEGVSVFIALGIGIGNSLEALIGTYLLKNFKFNPSISSQKDAFSLIFLAGFLSTLSSATIGAFSLYMGGAINVFSLIQTWNTWWFGNIMGNLLVASLIFVWSVPFKFNKKNFLETLEMLFYVFIVLAMGVSIFTDVFYSKSSTYLRAYLIFPLLVLVAARVGQRLTITLIFILSVIIIGATLKGQGRFWDGTFEERLLNAQLFIGVLIISKIVLAATVLEKRKKISEIRRSERCQRYLVEATTVISESMHYKATLKNITRAPVPYFADWCVLHALKREGGIDSIECYSKFFAKEKHLQSFVNQYYSDHSIVLNEWIHIKEVHCLTSAELNAHSELFEKWGFYPRYVAPLVSRNQLLGVLTFGKFHFEEDYLKEDLIFIEELARRSAIALENALLYLEAREAVSARDEFLSIASHELKTPLTSLSLRLQIVDQEISKCISKIDYSNLNSQAETVNMPLHVLELISSCEAQSRKLSSLLEELFDLTKIRSGNLQLEKAEVDLSGLISEVTERFQVEAMRNGVSFLVSSEPEVGGVMDRTRIEQVISNLISNALKYGNKNPIRIDIKKITHKRMIQFSIEDLGIGIPPEKINEVFQRFKRVDEMKGKVPGLGLGLYISKQIVEAHRGRIHVKSEVGKGSVFTVELPA